MEEAVKYLIVLALSLAPVSEVRGAVPVARALFTCDSEFVLASVIAVTGNLAIAPAVLYMLEYLEELIVRYGGFLGKTYHRALTIARRKSEKVRKYGPVGLALFVAVPLPATGAWTGSLVAYILGLPKSKSLVSIEIGVIIASSIVYTVTVLGLEIAKILFSI